MAVFRTVVMVLSAICLNWLIPAISHAQAYPVKPIRYILPSTGGTEIIGRLVAQGLTQTLGMQVYVDVRPGAATNLAAEIAARTPPDGYTVLQATQSHTANVSLFRKLSYDLLRDFSAVTKVDISPMIVVVHPSFPAKSIRELVKIAKARPGEINYGSAGTGTSTYLAAELFKLTAGVDLTEVSYRGGAPAQTSVVAGEVSVYFAPIATGLPLVNDKRLRLLGVSTAKRLPTLPDTPTVAEQGYPDYEASNWHGLVVPAKTPREIILTLRNATATAINQPDLNKRIRDLGYTVVGDQPEVFAEFLKADIEKWRMVVKQKGLSAD